MLESAFLQVVCCDWFETIVGLFLWCRNSGIGLLHLRYGSTRPPVILMALMFHVYIAFMHVFTPYVL
jgi:hypothetical protein